MLDVTTIPMEQFPLRWRLTDPKYRVLPPAHLEPIKPLDPASAKRLLEMTQSVGWASAHDDVRRSRGKVG